MTTYVRVIIDMAVTDDWEPGELESLLTDALDIRGVEQIDGMSVEPQ